MKQRIASAFFCALYLAVAAWLGMAHDECCDHSSSQDSTCRLCAWQATVSAEAPVEQTPIVAQLPVAPICVTHDVAPNDFFLLTTASRAPPAE